MNPNPAPIAQPSPRELNNAYADLLDYLNEAYWAAGTLEAKDQIKGVMDVVTSTITALDAADLTARDAPYRALLTNVTDVNKQLTALQTQISTIISRITTSQAVVSGISKVLTAAAKLFPGI